ncbi:MAG: VOC family protein [Chloroflexi bacterium]|nr:VOC family protein [Chloroflexota bacterium]
MTAGDDTRFLAARPNLHVEDVERSVAFYRDLLGFDTKTLMGEPPSFALLVREGAEIALVREENRAPTGCYIYVTGVEALHEHCQASGVRITYPLTLEPWGLLNFVIEDPDGHQIAIGERRDES